jgi:hypothetical protein
MTYTPYREVVDQLDAKLLEFFGTYENAQKMAHLYVIETTEPKFEIEPGSDLALTYSLSMEYRIRLKTEEELIADLGPEDM